MIKVKLEKLLESFGTLELVGNSKELPILTQWKLGEMIDEVKPHIIRFYKKRAQLEEIYFHPAVGASQADGDAPAVDARPAYPKSPEDKKKFNDLAEEMGEETVSVLAQPIPLSKFGVKQDDFENPDKAKIFNGNIFAQLRWLIKMDMEEAADEPIQVEVADAVRDVHLTEKGKRKAAE